MRILAKGSSMVPTLKDGQVYNMKLVHDEDINVGDIIVYCVGDLVVCHRVIKVIRTKNNMSFLKTKGDNCVEADPYGITFDMVIGIISLQCDDAM